MKKRFVVVFAFLIMAILFSACTAVAQPGAQTAQDPVKNQADNTKILADAARNSCNSDGCVEPKQLMERNIRDNDPAHVEYVYIVSPYTGKIIVSGVAVGKVSSTTKRLDASQTYVLSDSHDCGASYCTDWLKYDRVGADGAFGSSTEGIFWFDTAGIKYEVKVGGALVFTTEVPYVFANDVINTKIDIRVQSAQIDQDALALRNRIITWLKANPAYKPGDEIPLSVVTGK